MPFVIWFFLSALTWADAELTESSFSQFPSSLQWKVMSGPVVDVIYDASAEQQAQRYYQQIMRYAPLAAESGRSMPEKIALVLHNQTIISNGFVALAPRRSYFHTYEATGPWAGASDWPTILAIHEYRHVVQIQKTHQGLNRYLYYLMGETGQSLGFFFTLRRWFTEGDATLIESRHTSGGRGRDPDFLKLLRALAQEERLYHYDKVLLGSLKDLTPSPYPYGYLMNTLMESKLGVGFFDKVYAQSSRYSLYPFSFENALEDYSGHNIDDWHGYLYKWLKRFKPATAPVGQAKAISGQHSSYTDYAFPFYSAKLKKFYAMKSGFADLMTVVQLDPKNPEQEREVAEINLTPGGRPHFYQDRLYYMSVDGHPRWQQQLYHHLEELDLNTGQRRRLIENIRGLHPQRYRDQLAYVKQKTDGSYQIVIISLSTLETTHKISCQHLCLNPLWLNSQELLYLERDTQGKYRLQGQSLKTSVGPKQLFGPLGYPISDLFFHAQTKSLYFVSSFGGQNHIYQWRFSERKLERLDLGSIAAITPFVASELLLFSDFESTGGRIKAVPLTTLTTTTVTTPLPPQALQAPLLVPEKRVKKATTPPVSPPKPKDYHNSALNFHSWALFAPPLGPEVVAQLRSNDVLGNHGLALFSSYDTQDYETSAGAIYSYGGFYPQYLLALEHEWRRGGPLSNDQARWEQTSAELLMRLANRYFSGVYTWGWSFDLGPELVRATDRQSSYVYEVNDEQLLGGIAALRFRVAKQRTLRDIYPSLFLSARAIYKKLQGNKDSQGEFRLGQLQWGLPGLAPHHSFFGEIGQEQQLSFFDYRYSSVMSYPRGYRFFFVPDFTKLSVNYTLPLVYPDKRLGRYFYLKRVYANLFYDQVDLDYKILGLTGKRRSHGGELFFDSHFFRFEIPISWGIRYIRATDDPEDPTQVELALQTGFVL